MSSLTRLAPLSDQHHDKRRARQNCRALGSTALLLQLDLACRVRTRRDHSKSSALNSYFSTDNRKSPQFARKTPLARGLSLADSRATIVAVMLHALPCVWNVHNYTTIATHYITTLSKGTTVNSTRKDRAAPQFAVQMRYFTLACATNALVEPSGATVAVALPSVLRVKLTVGQKIPIVALSEL